MSRSPAGYGARSIFGRALATYRARFRVLGPMAVLVFSVGGVADAAAQLGADAVARGQTGSWGALLHTAAFLSGAVSSAGVVFYGGLTERIVAEQEHGGPVIPVVRLHGVIAAEVRPGRLNIQIVAPLLKRAFALNSAVCRELGEEFRLSA